MEQQKKSASIPPQDSPDHEPRQQLQSPHRESPTLTLPPPVTQASAKAQPSPPTRFCESLSESEPSLRFPRPVGNHHLANWISLSDPDIMRVITTPSDDAGLAGSTFELVTGADDDVLSQDDNDPDMISGSVSSLDAQRADDVHSLAGTEQLSDDDDFSQVNEILEPTPSSGREDILMDNGDFPSQAQNGVVDSDPETDSHSISSLEYTQQSLKAPSMANSESMDLPSDFHNECTSTSDDGGKEVKAVSNDFVKGFARRLRQWLPGTFTDDEAEQMLRMSPPYLLLVIGLLVLNYWGGIGSGSGYSPQDTIVPAIATTTTTTEPTSSLHPASTLSTTELRIVPTALVGGVDLVPIDKAPSHEWIFSPKKPEIEFKLISTYSILTLIPEDAKSSWISRNCITLAATRDGLPVDVTISSVKEGLLSRFPKSETHGVVELSLITSCKPTMSKVVRVHFGPSILEEVYEKTKNIALDIGDLVPAAAQEAERRLDDVRRSWNSLSSSFTTTALSVRGKFCNSLTVFTNWTDLNLGLNKATNKALQVATERLEEAGDTSKQLGIHLKLKLLDAQISAKILWLRATGDKEEWASYQNKAKQFMAEKRAVAAKLLGNHDQETSPGTFGCTSWSSLFTEGISRSRRRCTSDQHRPER